MKCLFGTALAATVLVVNGFSPSPPQKRHCFEINAESSTITEEAKNSRRSLLISTAAAVGTTTLFKKTAFSPKQKNTAITPVAVPSVQDAIRIIDDSCDRRYLHAVVSSNYRFLYRENNQEKQRITIHQNDPSLLSSAMNNYPEAAQQSFQQLEKVLQEDVIKPSNGLLAISTLAGGSSIWPLKSVDEEVHYAWFQEGGLFFPRRSMGSLDRSQLIVDGKDCGRDSLEDALSRDSCEVLVKAGSFLVVPTQYEEELRQGLQGAFLV